MGLTCVFYLLWGGIFFNCQKPYNPQATWLCEGWLSWIQYNIESNDKSTLNKNLSPKSSSLKSKVHDSYCENRRHLYSSSHSKFKHKTMWNIQLNGCGIIHVPLFYQPFHWIIHNFKVLTWHAWLFFNTDDQPKHFPTHWNQMWLWEPHGHDLGWLKLGLGEECSDHGAPLVRRPLR